MKKRISWASIAAAISLTVVWYFWPGRSEGDDYLDSATSRQACRFEDAGDWQSALTAWRKWNPKHPFCGTCDLSFQIRRMYRIFYCMGQIGEHASVASEILQMVQAACKPDDDWDRYARAQMADTFVPMLVEFYEKADQIDDLRRLVDCIELRAKVEQREKARDESTYAIWPTRSIYLMLQSANRAGDVEDQTPPPLKGSLPRVLPD